MICTLLVAAFLAIADSMLSVSRSHKNIGLVFERGDELCISPVTIPASIFDETMGVSSDDNSTGT